MTFRLRHIDLLPLTLLKEVALVLSVVRGMRCRGPRMRVAVQYKMSGVLGRVAGRHDQDHPDTMSN